MIRRVSTVALFMRKAYTYDETDAVLAYALRVPQRLPRFESVRAEAEWRNKLARILLEARAEPETVTKLTSAAAPGSLRGIPAIGRGSAGAVPGTDALRALIAKERRRGRRRT